ncbi:ribonuclease H-like domain-containing protein [Tanacetum coccineum]
MRENNKEEKVKQDMDEIETINIELEHSVAKLLSEKEHLHKEINHLKQIYKDQFNSVKRTRVYTKEHSESLILQLNSKSVENADLKAQIQDKMSETEPIPPTSSVTALRIPIIKKGEYDLWSMKMRQYIAITDHILWDIITNGNQTTTDPASPSVSAPKTSLAANARRNNEKALNILLSAIPDRHLLSFHDAVDARSLWKAIKARFGGNEASKKMQKNLLKQQFETFTIGSREELDSAYERFQHILSMLELHDATVSIEDANLKFLRSLPSVWHVVATMIRGQPGLDELDFDDLYNNLKVYEHELKGVSNSNSQNIAFLSTEVKGSTLNKIAMEEIGHRWAGAMITADKNKDVYEKNRRPLTQNQEWDHLDLVILTCGATQLMNTSVSSFDGYKLRGFGVEYSSSEENNNSSGDETLVDPLYENFKREKAYKAVPPPTGTIIPPRANVSFTGIDELAIRNKVVNQEKTKTSQPEIDRNKVIIKDWVDSDDEETGFSEKFQRKTGNSRYPHQKRSFTPSAVLTREGLKSTARPKMTRTVPSKSTANVFYQGTARPRLPHAVLSKSTDRPYYPRMDNIRPRTSSFSPSSRSSTSRTPYRSQRPKKIMKSIWVKKGSTVGSQAVLPQKATKDEAVLWHRRLGHVNFKNINKLVQGNLVRGLPSKTFKLDHSCLACRKGKQHRASCKKIEEREQTENL